MDEHTVHTGYSAADIERYLSGGMTVKEMHELERAALQDPFLADAIEGYREVPFSESNRHLNEITAAFANTSALPVPVISRSKKFSQLRAAAMVILLAGIGITGWYVSSLSSGKQKNQSVAALEKKAEVNATDTIAAGTGESVAASGTAAAPQVSEKGSLLRADSAIVDKKSFNAGGHTETSGLQDQDVSAADALTTDQLPKDKAEVSKDISPAAESEPLYAPVVSAAPREEKQVANAEAKEDKNRLAMRSGTSVASGFITDYSDAPVPFATVKVDNKNTAVLSDAKGFFQLPVTDSITTVTVASPGYEGTAAQVSATGNNRILLTPGNNSLAEIVVSSYGAKKAAKTNIADTGAVPVGGWQAFNNYVNQRMYVQVDSTLDVSGEGGNVEIEFSVDKNGNPFNFTVIKSPNEVLNAKAIELLKEGPKWIPTRKNRKGKVSIQFK